MYSATAKSGYRIISRRFSDLRRQRLYALRRSNGRRLREHNYFKRCINNLNAVYSRLSDSSQTSAVDTKKTEGNANNLIRLYSAQKTLSDIDSNIFYHSPPTPPKMNQPKMYVRGRESPHCIEKVDDIPCKRTVEYRTRAVKNNSNRISTVYSVDSNNTIYHVNFYAINCKIYPIHLEERSLPGSRQDKLTQSENYCHYKPIMNLIGSRFWTLRQQFMAPRVGRFLTRRNLNLLYTEPVPVFCSHKHHHDSEKARQRQQQRRQARISSTEKQPRDNGHIYLFWNHMEIRVIPHMFKMDSLREKYKHDHNSSTGARHNNVCLIARYKNDFLQFTFDMKQFSIQVMNVRTSRGNQVTNEHAYIPYFCDINSRQVVLMIPLSHYVFRDPLPRLHHINIRNAINKCEPSWMKNARRCRQADVVNRKLEPILKKINNQTLFNAELGGSLYKFRGSICVIPRIRQLDVYNEFVMNIQVRMAEQKANRISYDDNKEKMIPQWDFETFDV